MARKGFGRRSSLFQCLSTSKGSVKCVVMCSKNFCSTADSTSDSPERLIGEVYRDLSNESVEFSGELFDEEDVLADGEGEDVIKENVWKAVAVTDSGELLSFVERRPWFC